MTFAKRTVLFAFFLATSIALAATAAHSSVDAIKKRAEAGDRDAQFGLAVIYEKGEGVAKNLTEAMKWYRKASEAGEPFAQYILATAHYTGKGAPQNYSEAAYWYRRSAEQQLAIAQAMLGQMYYHGRGIQRSPEEAVRWWTSAAALGDKDAAHNLGTSLLDGDGVQADPAKAVSYYKMAAEAGYAASQTMLGILHLKGEVVPLSATDAARWFQLAAESGLRTAQNLLGNAYRAGEGVPQSFQTAARWYTLSAVQGDSESQSRLSELFERGDGVPKDLRIAFAWMNIAASTDNRMRDLYVTFRDRLATKLNTEDLEAARALSVRCVESSFADCGPATIAMQEADRRRQAKREPDGEKDTTGSGFLVSVNGHVVTNAHVVQGCKRLTTAGQTAKLVALDEVADLAVLSTTLSTSDFAKLAVGVSPGDRVIAVGYPLYGLLGSGLVATDGIVSALSGLQGNPKNIQITAPIQPGNSGGPLLGPNGGVVGVVVSKLNAIAIAEAIGDVPQNVNFAVNLGTLRDFLSKNGIPHENLNGTEKLEVADIVRSANKHTVVIRCDNAS